MPAVTRHTLGLRRLIGVLGAVTLILMLSGTGASAEESPGPYVGLTVGFSASPEPATAGQAVTFEDTSTYPSDCEVTQTWTFGDGSATVIGKKTVSHTYNQPGDYTVMLTIVVNEEEESGNYCYIYFPESEGDYPRFGNFDSFDNSGFRMLTTAYAGSTSCSSIQCTHTHTIRVNAAATPHTPNDNDDSDDNDDSNDDDDNDSRTAPAFPGATDGTETPTPTPTPTEEPFTDEPAITDPLPDPRPASGHYSGPVAPVIALMILAAVIGSLGRVGGLAVASRRAALVADRDENTVQRHVAARDAEGWGDRSFTWRFPGHGLIDAASTWVPDRFARFSPLIGRITEDGSEFRAMFGTLWLATPLAGIALGIAGAAAAGGRAMPPSVWLLVAGAVLAAFDAFSGALAVAVFAVAALLGDAAGGPDFVHSLLVLLAIGFLWMAIPLIGSAIRPFRRLGDGSVRHRWDVSADGLIAALLCGWVAQKLVQAMDLFAGQTTGLPQHANTVAIVVMAAVAVRVAMEHFSVSAYPKRLQQVEGEDPPPPLLLSSILGAFVRTAVFGFIGFAFIGSCWQLWLGIGLFLIPQLIEHIRESFPNFGVIKRVLPRGVVEIFILVVACTLAARFAMSQSPDQFTGLRLAFLLIAVPPALIGALAMLAEDDDAESKTTWPREFLGALIVVATTILATRGWDY